MSDKNESAPQSSADSPRTDDSDPIEPADKLVPVGEAIRYRKRAQTAEQQVERLNSELQDIGAKLEEANQTITGLERRQRADALLTEADAIDLETARLLTEQAVLEMDEPDVRLAVADLRQHKPYLFRRNVHPEPSALAPAVGETGHDPAEMAAQDAARTGDRRDLLKYLRLRRTR